MAEDTIEDICTEKACKCAKREFDVIKDLLLVPLKQDNPDQGLPERRRWKGGCLPVLLPDLLPVNPSPSEGLKGFCTLVDPAQPGTDHKLLRVIVKNQGSKKAGLSTTKVFLLGEKIKDELNAIAIIQGDFNTQELEPGSSTEVRFKFPTKYLSECRETGSNCKLIISVNDGLKVAESDVNNNAVIVVCNFETDSNPND